MKTKRVPTRSTGCKSLRRGFALVETVISLLILAVAILSIAMVPIMSSKMALQTVKKEQAMTLAYSGLDFLESVPPDEEIASGDMASGDFLVSYAKPEYDAASDDYRAVVTVRWHGVTGSSQLVLERILSRFANRTREE